MVFLIQWKKLDKNTKFTNALVLQIKFNHEDTYSGVLGNWMDWNKWGKGLDNRRHGIFL